MGSRIRLGLAACFLRVLAVRVRVRLRTRGRGTIAVGVRVRVSRLVPEHARGAL